MAEKNYEKSFRELNYEDKIKRLMEAISKGEYEISYESPNNIEIREHPDGSKFAVLSGDDCKFGVSAGSCSVKICGLWFTCNLNDGYWSCDKNGELVKDEELIEAIENINDVICGSHQDDYDMISLYEAMNDCTIDEYYSCYDDDIPMDKDSMKYLPDFIDLVSVDFEDETYYFNPDDIEEDTDDEYEGRRWVYAAYGDPDNYGKFSAVILTFEGETKDDPSTEIVSDLFYIDEMMDQEGIFEE